MLLISESEHFLALPMTEDVEWAFLHVPTEECLHHEILTGLRLAFLGCMF